MHIDFCFLTCRDDELDRAWIKSMFIIPFIIYCFVTMYFVPRPGDYGHGHSGSRGCSGCCQCLAGGSESSNNRRDEAWGRRAWWPVLFFLFRGCTYAVLRTLSLLPFHESWCLRATKWGFISCPEFLNGVSGEARYCCVRALPAWFVMHLHLHSRCRWMTTRHEQWTWSLPWVPPGDRHSHAQLEVLAFLETDTHMDEGLRKRNLCAPDLLMTDEYRHVRTSPVYWTISSFYLLMMSNEPTWKHTSVSKNSSPHSMHF